MLSPLPILLSVTGLSIGYRSKTIVEDITCNLACGEVLAVVGHNGSGKSTLVKTLLGSLPPLAGLLDWPTGRPRSIAHLGQGTDFDSRVPIRVRDVVEMGAWPGLGLFGRIDNACRDRIGYALERTGITEIADMPLHKISSGQLQRTLFARTIVQDAQLILLDEPFTAVDQTTEDVLIRLVDDWATEGRTIILILHDLSTVLQHCNSVLLLGGGGALFGVPKQTLTPGNLIAYRYLSQSQAAWLGDMYSQSIANYV